MLLLDQIQFALDRRRERRTRLGEGVLIGGATLIKKAFIIRNISSYAACDDVKFGYWMGVGLQLANK